MHTMHKIKVTIALYSIITYQHFHLLPIRPKVLLRQVFVTNHNHINPGIAVKLRPLVKALKDAERITHEATSALDAGDWAPERLERDREPTDGTEDALDQLVSCARSLTEDVRRAASFINGNASLLFR